MHCVLLLPLLLFALATSPCCPPACSGNQPVLATGLFWQPTNQPVLVHLQTGTLDAALGARDKYGKTVLQFASTEEVWRAGLHAL